MFLGVVLCSGEEVHVAGASCRLTQAWLSALPKKSARVSLFVDGSLVCTLTASDPGAHLNSLCLGPGTKLGMRADFEGAQVHLTGFWQPGAWAPPQIFHNPLPIEHSAHAAYGVSAANTTDAARTAVAAATKSASGHKGSLLLAHSAVATRAPRSPLAPRTPRLRFNPEVLYAEYTPLLSGISPARMKIELNETGEPTAALAPSLISSCVASSAPKGSRTTAEESSSSDRTRSDHEAPKKRNRLSSESMLARLSELVSNESEGGKEESKSGLVSRSGDTPPSGGGRSQLGEAVCKLLAIRIALLQRSPIKASQAAHSLLESLPQLKLDALVASERRASSGLLRAFGRLEEQIELLLSGIGPLLAPDAEGKRMPKRWIELVVRIDSCYFDLTYEALTGTEGAPPLYCGGGGGGGGRPSAEEMLLSPAAFLRASHPARWRATLQAKLEALSGGKKAGERAGEMIVDRDGEIRGAVQHPGRGVVALAVAAHVQLLHESAVEKQGENPLFALWRLRWLESLQLLERTGLASSDAYAKIRPPSSERADAEPPAPKLVQLWRRSEREWPCWMLAFAVPSPAAVDMMRRHSPLVEMGAGVGYWAKLAEDAGAQVDAFDSAPPRRAGADGAGRSKGGGGARRAKNTFHGECPAFVHVGRGGPETLAQPRWRGHTLLLCYPPPGSPMAAECLKAFSGETCIHIGEWLGDTGAPSFEELLAAEWSLKERLLLPNWGDTFEDLTVWRRRPAAARDVAAQLHPVLACDTCGRAGSLKLPRAANKPGTLRRCRWCRLACYCSERCAKAGWPAHERYHALKMVSHEPGALSGSDYQTVCT